MSDQPHYHGHRQRLKDKLAKEPTQLADYEVLELLLGQVLPRRDTKPLAKELLARFKTFRGVFTARPEELRKIKGFGPALENFWVLLSEFRARFGEAVVQDRVVFDSPKVVAELAISRLGGNPTEELWLALVDNRNRLIAWDRLSRGTVDEAPVYPREVLGLALEKKASGIIMVHNHPGGDPKPSNQDVEMTQRIARACRDLGVRLLDHLIVTENDFFSFQAQGML